MSVNDTQYGHLLLADITGYISYVATTELTHSLHRPHTDHTHVEDGDDQQSD